MTRPSISAFFPAYNDGGTIASMVITADVVLRQLADDYEIIVVNDGSKDYTDEVLRELEARYERLRVIRHEKNRGYGGALRSGFAAARKDLVFYTDGDAQYDVHELPTLVAALDTADVVNGYKISRSDPLVRIVVGRLYHHVVRLAFGLRLKDVDCDYRLLRREVFDHISLECSSGAICVELMKKIQDAGFAIRQVPVHHYHRAYGGSQFFNVPRIVRSICDLAQLWHRLVWQTRRQRRGAGACSTSHVASAASEMASEVHD
ncbi:MAG: glycosyltransferase family 2 protein [Chloroflexi bacterium]|nr:glycosyltransferase family 2 protein [Chloroflexota bacterium]